MSPRIFSSLIVIAGLSALMLAQAEAAPTPADPERQAEQYVIPPGAEPLFSDMLGGDQALPGGCTLSDGQIERTTVRATYACPGGQVAIVLAHPATAPAEWVRTERFALSVASGSPPDGMVQAIAERIRAREGAFTWKAVGGTARTSKTWLSYAAGGIVVLLILVWAMRRFQSGPRKA